jgi:hypothetical protein
MPKIIIIIINQIYKTEFFFEKIIIIHFVHLETDPRIGH